MSHQHSVQAPAVDIDAYNSTAVRLPEGALHELFAAQAARTPDAVALVCGERELTYRELDSAATALAHRLRDRGVRPGDGVGLFQDRSLAYVVAMLAVLKAGGAYVPLDPRQPEERRAFILADTGAVLLLTDRDERDVAFAGDLPVLRLTEDVTVPERDDAAALDVPVHPDQSAYVMCRSRPRERPVGSAASRGSWVGAAPSGARALAGLGGARAAGGGVRRRRGGRRLGRRRLRRGRGDGCRRAGLARHPDEPHLVGGVRLQGQRGELLGRVGQSAAPVSRGVPDHRDPRRVGGAAGLEADDSAAFHEARPVGDVGDADEGDAPGVGAV
ncbi:AMP-binding protein [Streptomyces massasporeus]